jgi:hypothetical protein
MSKDIVKDVCDFMYGTSDEIKYYYDKVTKKFILVSTFNPDNIDEESENLISLPDKYDINDYAIMVGFVQTLTNENNANALADALRGKSVFQRFKNTLKRLGIEQDWYKFRDEKYYEIAKDWCNKYGLI